MWAAPRPTHSLGRALPPALCGWTKCSAGAMRTGWSRVYMRVGASPTAATRRMWAWCAAPNQKVRAWQLAGAWPPQLPLCCPQVAGRLHHGCQLPEYEVHFPAAHPCTPPLHPRSHGTPGGCRKSWKQLVRPPGAEAAGRLGACLRQRLQQCRSQRDLQAGELVGVLCMRVGWWVTACNARAVEDGSAWISSTRQPCHS